MSKFLEYCNSADWTIIILISVYESFLSKKKHKKPNNETAGLVFKQYIAPQHNLFRVNMTSTWTSQMLKSFVSTSNRPLGFRILNIEIVRRRTFFAFQKQPIHDLVLEASHFLFTHLGKRTLSSDYYWMNSIYNS